MYKVARCQVLFNFFYLVCMVILFTNLLSVGCLACSMQFGSPRRMSRGTENVTVGQGGSGNRFFQLLSMAQCALNSFEDRHSCWFSNCGR